MNLEGKVIGNRYEIIEKIGVGGMATVYKAKCRVLNRYVAIKILREEFITDEEFIKRFNSEAQAAASLSHPNIVAVYDVACEGDLYYIVMELIKGKTLKEIIIADKVLPWKWSVNVAIQIAQALEVAHKNGIVHRDIKPHNIIITEEGVAKVTDFGIAKAVSNSTITAFGNTIGSVHYFSPEQAKGGYVDAKSDLYSLGVVMYEMLTGKVPFDADTPVSIALKHMQEKPLEPREINPNIPISVNNVIMKALKKDTTQRYSSATEMLQDLKLTLKNPDTSLSNESVEDELEASPTQRFKAIDEPIIEENGKKSRKFKEWFSKHKAIGISIIILICILIFFLVMIITYSILSIKPKEVQLPNLVGVSKEEAISQLESLKLEYEIIEEKYDDVVEANLIISQEPPYQANYTVLENSKVSLIISKGQEIVKVPAVEGKTIEEAKTIIEATGLVLKIEEENNDKVEAGYVVKQDLTPETDVPGKSTITLVVSKGIKMCKVPSLIGKTESDAKAALEAQGLKLALTNTDTDTTKDDGVVLKQSVEAGSEIEEGTGVTITINSLPTIKTGTVNLKLSTFSDYVEVKDPITGQVTSAPSKVKVVVKVTSQGSEDTVYNEDVLETKENVNIGIEGVGNVTVKVYISGVLKTTKTLNLNQTNPELTISK